MPLSLEWFSPRRTSLSGPKCWVLCIPKCLEWFISHYTTGDILHTTREPWGPGTLRWGCTDVLAEAYSFGWKYGAPVLMALSGVYTCCSPPCLSAKHALPMVQQHRSLATTLRKTLQKKKRISTGESIFAAKTAQTKWLGDRIKLSPPASQFHPPAARHGRARRVSAPWVANPWQYHGLWPTRHGSCSRPRGKLGPAGRHAAEGVALTPWYFWGTMDIQSHAQESGAWSWVCLWGPYIF